MRKDDLKYFLNKQSIENFSKKELKYISEMNERLLQIEVSSLQKYYKFTINKKLWENFY